MLNERVENCWHYEVCDARSSISQSSGEGVCSADNVLIEEASSPDLTRNEGASQYPDEKSQYNQSSSALNRARQRCGDGARYKDSSKGPPGTKSVAQSSRTQSNYQGRGQGDNVRVGYFRLRQVEIFLDGHGQQWRKGIPGPERDEEGPPRE